MVKVSLQILVALTLLAPLTGLAQGDLITTTGSSADSFGFGPCYARFTPAELVIGNAHLERTWLVKDGLLYARSLRDVDNETEWLGSVSDTPSLIPTVLIPDEPRKVRFSAKSGTFGPTEAPSLVAELRAEGQELTLVYRFQVFPDARGIIAQLETLGPYPHEDFSANADGDILEDLILRQDSVHLINVAFQDRTDHQQGDLVVETEWFSVTSGTLALQANVLICEDPETQNGLLFLKHAPLPHARPYRTENDFVWVSGPNRLTALGHGTGNALGKGYRCVALVYTGGRAGRIAALQQYQRQLRLYEPHRDGMFLSNTWGDRNRDGRIQDSFLRKEVEAGARLGVDIVQVDDGWQQGRSKNSVDAGGVWIGFWAFDPNFWQPDPVRFPEGLSPLIDLAARHGMRFGLWYAADSINDFENASRDAARILELHRTLGVNYFKIDAIDIKAKIAELRLTDFLQRVIRESDGRIVIDLDVTTATRPGYFAIPNTGPIFVENRYSDWNPHPKAYWPHLTLRNFWQLAQYIDPVRLRMEFLNNTRNQERYGDDPLAPARYRPAYLFATVMFSSPLGWFEVSNLPDSYFDEVAPLVKLWKQHREQIFRGRIIPIGEPPNGKSWTGFTSVAEDGESGYILVFRELNGRPQWTTGLPLFAKGEFDCKVLSGQGAVRLVDNTLTVEIPASQDFIFARVEKGTP